MSLARVQFFTVSLDGFGTGEPQSHEAPFGHAGERLHEWMFGTRSWNCSSTITTTAVAATAHPRRLQSSGITAG